MKTIFEVILPEVNRKKTQRRRMLSLLLVLSLFVTSGVSWALHGVGLTMANEAECGIEEHIHTDACWERRLVCGLDGDAEHVHTDECWEMQLVCGLPEHIHDAACYTGSVDYAALLGGSSVTLDEALADATGIAADDTDDYVIEPAEDEDFELRAPVLRAAGDEGGGEGEEDEKGHFDEQGRYVVNTIDNIAEGIKFTLFDYGDSNLENPNNRYTWVWDDENKVWTHPQVTDFGSGQLGWRASGINTGKNPEQDILFFALGTPVDSYCKDEDVHNYFDDNGVHQYLPDKNSYAGDYNSDPVYPGNRPVQGIVNNTLTDGYPTIAGSNHSLDYLFKPSTDVGGDQSAYKKVYTDVNHLLQRDEKTGHLVYNSNENYAYYDQSTGNFIVYEDDPNDPDGFKGTFDIVNSDHHAAGTYDNFKCYPEGHEKQFEPVYYENELNSGFKVGFFPFDEYDTARNDPNYDGAGYNHHFGMTMEAEFTNQPYDGVNVKQPITFKYSGDDDMWVFVDNKLVLDLGGIHEPAGGMIDFSNGLVWVQDNGKGMPLTSDNPDTDSVLKTLTEWGKVNEQNPLKHWDDLPKPIGIDTSSAEEDKWFVYKIEDFLGEGWNNTENHEHKINMFYLERGGCYSNLAMEMNLPTLKPLNVIKNVDYQHHYVNGLYENYSYWFQIWEHKEIRDPDTNELLDEYWVKATDIPDNRFQLKDGGRKVFSGLGTNRDFQIVEEGYDPNDGTGYRDGIDTDIFQTVTVNGQAVDLDEDGYAASGYHELQDVNSYTFVNQIVEKTEPLTVYKQWEPKDSDGNPIVPEGFTEVKFKIMRTDTKNGEVKQVAMKKDGVKKRVFVMSTDDWTRGYTLPDELLKQYGDHTYEYTIEELNIPRGYKATYIDNKNGTYTIINTDMNKLDLNVRKEWVNPPPGDENGEHTVELTLKRTYVEYLPSQPTQVHIRIEDEAGNLLTEYTSPKYTEGQTEPYKGVYVGGSEEFYYQIPEGAELWTDSSNTPFLVQSPSTLGVKFEIDENIVVLSNFAEQTAAQAALGEIPNQVTFRLRTEDAKDELLLLHYPFNETTQGWGVQNGDQTNATATFESGSSYGKNGGSLRIGNRSNSFNGATLPLDPAKFKANGKYTFSVYVYSPIEDDFKITFNNGLGGYVPITDPPQRVPANTWTQLTGTVTLSDEIDPYNMFLVIESLPANGNYNDYPLKDGGTYFLIDEFTAIAGDDPVKVNAAGEVVIGEDPQSQSQTQTQITTIYDFQFQNGDSSEGWLVQDFAGNHNTVIEQGSNYGFNGIRVSGRDVHNDGIFIQVPLLEPGKTYHFSGRVQEDNTDSAQTLQLTLNTGTGQYPPIVQDIRMNTTSNDNFEHHPFGVDYLIPADADRNTMSIYFETPQSSNDIGSFRVHYLTITEEVEVTTPGPTPTPEELDPVSGYDGTSGQYISDNSNYKIVPDDDSVTNPLNLENEQYADDETFSRTVTLSGRAEELANWMYHWDNDASRLVAGDDPMNPADQHYIYEDNEHRLYEYQIAEVRIDGVPVRTYDGKEVCGGEGEMFDYLVTYENNNVATNEPGNPIIVRNTYIWYRLPDTGGMGANGYFITGLLLAMTGMIGGYALKRRERRFR